MMRLKYRCVVETRLWWSSVISVCHDTVIMTLSFMTLHQGCAVLTDGFVDSPMSHMRRCGRRNWFSHSLRSYTTDTGEKQGKIVYSRGQMATEEEAYSANSCVLGSWGLVPIGGFFYPINVSNLLSSKFAEPVVVHDCLMLICFENPSTLTNSWDPN